MENGLSINTVSKMSNNQINLMVEKFLKYKKEETKEAWTEVTTSQKKLTAPVDSKDLTVPPPPPGKTQKVTVSGNTIQLTQNEGEMTEDVNVDKDNATAGQISQDPHQVQAPDGMDDLGDATIDKEEDLATEGVIKEKFESKAQQGLFWARCNKCSDKKCKWCKMAKEFSDSTTKKEYKDMPEKKHPEKTVKKKEKTNEDLQKYVEQTIIEMLETQVNARMTKKDLIEAIKETKQKEESFIIRKPKKVTMFSDEAPVMDKPIGKLFSTGKSKK